MKKAACLLIVLVMLCTIGMGSFNADITESGGTDTSIVTLDTVGAAFNVTVPTVLPIWVDGDNNVTVSDNARIINNCNGPIEISNVSVTADDGWNIVSYDTDFTKIPVDTKQYGMIMQGNNDVIHGVPAESFEVIDGGESLAVTYNGNVAIQSEAYDSASIGNVVFTIRWSSEIAPTIMPTIMMFELPQVRAARIAPQNDHEYFVYHSINLASSLGVNFYIDLPDGEDPDDYYVDFSWGHQFATEDTVLSDYQYINLPKTSRSTLIDGTDEPELFISTVDIAARDMNDTITAILYKSGNNEPVATNTYKAADYMYEQIRLNNDPDLVSLCKATLTYGASVQVEQKYYDAYNTNELTFPARVDNALDNTNKYTAVYTANHDTYSTELEQYNIKQKNGLPAYMGLYTDSGLNSYMYSNYGHSYYATAISTTSKIGYIMQLRDWENGHSLSASDFSANWTDDQITCESPAVEFISRDSTNKRDWYSVTGIPAAFICEDITITIGEKAFIINCGSYLYDCLNLNDSSEKSTNMKYTAANLYNYYKTAASYFS